MPFARCICTIMWHLWPIPDNVHHALYVSYAVQCTDLAHIKRCFIFLLRFKQHITTNDPIPISLCGSNAGNGSPLVRVTRSMSYVAIVLRCPPVRGRRCSRDVKTNSTSCYLLSFQVCWSKIRSRLHLWEVSKYVQGFLLFRKVRRGARFL